MELGLVPLSVLETAWKEAKPHLQKAIDQSSDGISLSDVYLHLCVGKMQLWGMWEEGHAECAAFLVTQFNESAMGCTLLLRLLSGMNRELWFHFLPVVEDWALNNGATRIELWGRKGWQKVMRSHGYKTTSVVLSKELRPARMDS